MLSDAEIVGNLTGLFYSRVDPRNAKDVWHAATAFKNLSLHCIELTAPDILEFVRFDENKIQMMLKRFYRDAFGVSRFERVLTNRIMDQELRRFIFSEVNRLSVRIGSPKPRKTRVAAAFSLWMATFRPIFLTKSTDLPIVWKLDALINFFLATGYLRLYGNVKIGQAGNDKRVRQGRILYDFTVRDLNLSSLEMLYCSIFLPNESGDGTCAN